MGKKKIEKKNAGSPPVSHHGSEGSVSSSMSAADRSTFIELAEQCVALYFSRSSEVKEDEASSSAAQPPSSADLSAQIEGFIEGIRNHNQQKRRVSSLSSFNGDPNAAAQPSPSGSAPVGGADVPSLVLPPSSQSVEQQSPQQIAERGFKKLFLAYPHLMLEALTLDGVDQNQPRSPLVEEDSDEKQKKIEKSKKTYFLLRCAIQDAEIFSYLMEGIRKLNPNDPSSFLEQLFKRLADNQKKDLLAMIAEQRMHLPSLFLEIFLREFTYKGFLNAAEKAHIKAIRQSLTFRQSFTDAEQKNLCVLATNESGAINSRFNLAASLRTAKDVWNTARRQLTPQKRNGDKPSSYAETVVTTQIENIDSSLKMLVPEKLALTTPRLKALRKELKKLPAKGTANFFLGFAKMLKAIQPPKEEHRLPAREGEGLANVSTFQQKIVESTTQEKNFIELIKKGWSFFGLGWQNSLALLLKRDDESAAQRFRLLKEIDPPHLCLLLKHRQELYKKLSSTEQSTIQQRFADLLKPEYQEWLIAHIDDFMSAVKHCKIKFLPEQVQFIFIKYPYSLKDKNGVLDKSQQDVIKKLISLVTDHLAPNDTTSLNNFWNLFVQEPMNKHPTWLVELLFNAPQLFKFTTQNFWQEMLKPEFLFPPELAAQQPPYNTQIPLVIKMLQASFPAGVREFWKAFKTADSQKLALIRPLFEQSPELFKLATVSDLTEFLTHDSNWLASSKEDNIKLTLDIFKKITSGKKSIPYSLNSQAAINLIAADKSGQYGQQIMKFMNSEELSNPDIIKQIAVAILENVEQVLTTSPGSKSEQMAKQLYEVFVKLQGYANKLNPAIVLKKRDEIGLIDATCLTSGPITTQNSPIPAFATNHNQLYYLLNQRLSFQDLNANPQFFLDIVRFLPNTTLRICDNSLTDDVTAAQKETMISLVKKQEQIKRVSMDLNKWPMSPVQMAAKKTLEQTVIPTFVGAAITSLTSLFEGYAGSSVSPLALALFAGMIIQNHFRYSGALFMGRASAIEGCSGRIDTLVVGKKRSDISSMSVSKNGNNIILQGKEAIEIKLSGKDDEKFALRANLHYTYKIDAQGFCDSTFFIDIDPASVKIALAANIIIQEDLPRILKSLEKLAEQPNCVLPPILGDCEYLLNSFVDSPSDLHPRLIDVFINFLEQLHKMGESSGLATLLNYIKEGFPHPGRFSPPLPQIPAFEQIIKEATSEQLPCLRAVYPDEVKRIIQGRASPAFPMSAHVPTFDDAAGPSAVDSLKNALASAGALRRISSASLLLPLAQTPDPGPPHRYYRPRAFSAGNLVPLTHHENGAHLLDSPSPGEVKRGVAVDTPPPPPSVSLTHGSR